jgi:hypothetical protein
MHTFALQKNLLQSILHGNKMLLFYTMDIWVDNIELWKAAEIKDFQIIRLQDKSQKTNWYI